MKLLLTISIIVLITLLASSRKFWSMRRKPIIATMSAGGWFIVAIGVLIGPAVLGVITTTEIKILNSVVLFSLGWIGLTIGLQLTREILQFIPSRIYLIAASDLLLGVTIIALPMTLLTWFFYPDQKIAPIFALYLLFALSFAGWPSGLRSLRVASIRPSQEMSQVLRATAGISSMLSVCCFGVAVKLFLYHDSRATDSSLGLTFSTGLLLSVIVALAVGFVGSLFLRLAGRSQGEVMTLFFGIVALSSGSAVVLGLSPLFVSMLAGIVIALSSDYNADRFQRYILEAERPFAMALLLVAGMICDPNVGLFGGMLIIVGIAGRILAKQFSAQLISAATTDENSSRVALLATIKQSSLSVVLIANLTPQLGLLSPQLHFPAEKLLAVVIAVGLISAMLPTVLVFKNSLEAKA